MGGKVENRRTDGYLAISRSLGDFFCYGVSSVPDIEVIDLENDDRRLILCCDGVFDVITNEEVAEMTVNAKSARDLAYDLRKD